MSPSVRSGLAAAAGAISVGSMGTGPRALAGAIVGAWLGRWALHAIEGRRERARRAQVQVELPGVLDRLHVCVVAGMSVERALRTVGPATTGPVGEALMVGVRALDVGVPRAQAYERIAGHASVDEVRRVVAALARAERYGTPAAATLARQADELRGRARAAAEADARTAPVRLIFPLVFCFLPAFILLTIAPVAITAVKTLGGI